MLEVVIFDFDGVIADSEMLHLSAFNSVIAPFGMEISKADYFKNYLGLSDLDLFKLLANEGLLNVDTAQIDELAVQKNLIFEELAQTRAPIIAGVSDVLEMLSESKIPMAICSGALLGEIEMILERSGLSHFFEVIVSTEQVKKGKPHPEGFQLTLKRLNHGRANPITAGKCVVIEDSHWGLEAAAAAGMHTVAITNSYEAEQLSMADIVIDHLSELSIDSLRQLCS
jgi:beta-phosphoglucomutase